MDASRVSFGETVAAVSGIALFLLMFIDWFGYDASEGLVAGPYNAWQWMGFLDVLLFLAIAVAIGVAVARATGTMPANPAVAPGQLLAAAGGLALLIVVFRLLVPGDGPAGGADVLDVDATRKIGVFLGLIAAAGMAYGGWTAMNERPAGAGTAPRPSPPSSEPPPP